MRSGFKLQECEQIVATVLVPATLEKRPVEAAPGARRKPLQFDDIWELPAHDKVENISNEFEKHWQAEMQGRKPSLVGQAMLGLILFSNTFHARKKQTSETCRQCSGCL